MVDNPAVLSIARTQVAVYEVAGRCSQLELGDLTDQELEPGLVAEQVLVEGSTPTAQLTGLSRTDPKLIVARAYGPDERLVAIGCAEYGEVTGHVSVHVTTEIAASASVQLADRTVDPTGVSVVVTDPYGAPIDHRRVSWRVWGPAGAESAITDGVVIEPHATWIPEVASCTTGGVVTIHPVPPDLVGAYVMQPRVAWAADRVPTLSNLQVEAVATLFGAVPGVTHPCAIGQSTTGPRLVCLTSSTEVSTFTVAPTGELTAASATTLGFAPVGLYATPVGTTTSVFALGAGGQLSSVFPTVAPATCTGCGLVAIDDVIVVPACKPTDVARALFHTAATAGSLRWLPATGGMVQVYPYVDVAGSSAELSSAGCVTTLDHAGTFGIEQAVAIDVLSTNGMPARTRLQFACSGGMCDSVGLPSPRIGVGFSGEAQPSLVGTALDSTGAVLVRWFVLTGGAASELLELGRQPTAVVPQRISAGHLDDDNEVDLVWTGSVGRAPVIQLAYARLAGDSPLSALAFLRAGNLAEVVDLLLDDVTGDGEDDVIVVSRGTASAILGITVLPTHVPAPPQTIPTDAPCP